MLLLSKANAKLEGLSFFWESIDFMWLNDLGGNGGKKKTTKKNKKSYYISAAQQAEG